MNPMMNDEMPRQQIQDWAGQLGATAAQNSASRGLPSRFPEIMNRLRQQRIRQEMDDKLKATHFIMAD